MIARILGAETPQDAITVAVEVKRLIAFCVVTATARTHRLTTAVVIGH